MTHFNKANRITTDSEAILVHDLMHRLVFPDEVSNLQNKKQQPSRWKPHIDVRIWFRQKIELKEDEGVTGTVPPRDSDITCYWLWSLRGSSSC